MNHFLILNGIKYYLTVKNKKKYPTSFVNELINHITNKKHRTISIRNTANHRKQLKQDKTILEANKFNKNVQYSVSTIARTSSIRHKYGLILNSLIQKFDPKTILELGTCFGLSASYMLEGSSKDSKLISIEGNPQRAKIAKKYLENVYDSRIEIINDNIDQALPLILKKVKKVDFVFLDANHTYIAVKKYFEILKKHVHEDTIIVFDDIYWSKGMNKAWKEIINETNITLSIDLFQLGIVFFRKEEKKQDYRIKY